MLPTELLPLYKLLDGDTLEELEDQVTDFIQQHEKEGNGWWLSGSPQLIRDINDDEYFIQAVGAYNKDDE